MPVNPVPHHSCRRDARRGVRLGVALWLGSAAALLATSAAAAVIPIAGRHADESRPMPVEATEVSRPAAPATSRPPAAAAARQRPAPASTPAAARAR